jgi:hypothetical protein
MASPSESKPPPIGDPRGILAERELSTGKIVEEKQRLRCYQHRI